MDPDDLKAQAIALHDRFTHETHDRRAFMADLAKLAGGSAAAGALLATIGADPAAAAIIPADDPRLKTSNVRWTVAPGRVMHGYMALPAKARGRQPAIMVIHENRGLNDYVRDVARRVALAGYVALAPDFLSTAGGTPADQDVARDMIGKLDLPRIVQDGVATLAWLKGNRYATGKVGVVGFCWGGAMVNRLAVAGGDALAAGVAYYGPAPDPSEAAKVKAAMTLHYAGLDERVNKTAQPWIDALKAAGVPVQAYFYPGVSHAFYNDTSVDRYDKAAADLSWQRTLAAFKAALA
ncbi:dienelactone hydrolase family protein [Sphingomonas prati]|uniref:Carboxymethylenebutenolidase n=1 Tax=Sphingomonas prati TaxID=1843237 RepID=A0A7W9BVD2_9SPHN|nr:dienelactone hydrolase family protein [Sphingomonas prati]MBB5730554.1 carboxymethylenebutenolidase [Sphingomonas prati]GGE94925.1 carboxymethylenebutenolidase [Sphingomonas prati]